MQDALRVLNEYWTDRGCMVVQPFNTEVGAGTMNPATIMRVLGPEPWRVAYVEPSVRPDDSRYGQNPNRLQTHTQFQVILKPDPGNPQDLYLGSLKALGVDLDKHDVRFVEDNWAQPAIGAWGLGWEVWLDGLEITQFTYFQQVGGQNLDPVSVELTYGIERILMALQGVTHFKDISYAPGISYGEAFGQTEYEMSRYYIDDADIATNQQLFDAYTGEAARLIEARLPVPAHTYVLKSSHAFNVLDSRGAISTTERAKAFSTMRGLSRDVAKLWVERREELDFPLIKDTAPAPPEVPAVDVDLPTAPQDVAFEIGTEELPPHVVPATVNQVRQALSEALEASRLDYGPIDVDATPRRVVATIAAVSAHEPDAQRLVKGPKWAQAFDADGQPTRALQGFARGQGVDPADVIEADINGSQHAAVTKTDAGRSAMEVLGEAMASIVTSLRADKNMRWSDPELSFSRAVRWILALWGDHVIPFRAGHLLSGRTTYVQRQDPDPVVDLATAADLLPTLTERNIVLSSSQRRVSVIEQAERLAGQVGGSIDVDAEAAVIDEITNLVEDPRGIRGTFDERYLDLPDAILTTVMRSHQRYLPVRGRNNELLPYFVAMANGPCDTDAVATGNESVLRARYEDALFFWNTDLADTNMDRFVPALDKLTFEDRLGSMGDRAGRIRSIAAQLAQRLDATKPLSPAERETLNRAGELVKFDLATQIVTEMSSLAGFVAGQYASRTGESREVAQALVETEQPHTVADTVPSSLPGALLAAADRADLLAGMFAIGTRPTGSSDPFGLRRAALGLVRLLREVPALTTLDIGDVLDAAVVALTAQGVVVPDNTIDDASQFIQSRFAQLMRDEGLSADIVTAVLPGANRPGAVAAALSDIEAVKNHDAGPGLISALVRIDRIVPAATAPTWDTNVLVEDEEKALERAVNQIDENATLQELLTSHQGFAPAINTFFDAVLVMDPDEALRDARLGLLQAARHRGPRTIDMKSLDNAFHA